jgi:hypothetical protein
MQISGSGIDPLEAVQTGKNDQLIKGVKSGALNKQEFTDLVSYKDETEKLRTKVRHGGYTSEDMAKLSDREKNYQKMYNTYAGPDASARDPQASTTATDKNSVEKLNQLNTIYDGLVDGKLTEYDGDAVLNRHEQISVDQGIMETNTVVDGTVKDAIIGQELGQLNAEINGRKSLNSTWKNSSSGDSNILSSGDDYNKRILEQAGFMGNSTTATTNQTGTDENVLQSGEDYNNQILQQAGLTGNSAVPASTTDPTLAQQLSQADDLQKQGKYEDAQNLRSQIAEQYFKQKFGSKNVLDVASETGSPLASLTNSLYSQEVTKAYNLLNKFTGDGSETGTTPATGDTTPITSDILLQKIDQVNSRVIQSASDETNADEVANDFNAQIAKVAMESLAMAAQYQMMRADATLLKSQGMSDSDITATIKEKYGM